MDGLLGGEPGQIIILGYRCFLPACAKGTRWSMGGCGTTRSTGMD